MSRPPWVAVVLVGAALVAQDDPIAAFDALAAAAETSSPATTEMAASTAVTVFLRLPAGPARTQRLAAASRLASWSKQHGLALDLVGEARSAQRGDARTAAAELRSNVALGRFTAFVEAAQRAQVAGHSIAVEAALQADEGQLLPGADRLLRTGGTDAAMWIFVALAAQAPRSAMRLANLGLAQRHVGDLAGAKASYREALALAPRDEQIWNDYALLLRCAGEFEAALAALRQSQAVEAATGAGPAITNLVYAEVVRRGSVEPQPLPGAGAALALRPDAQLLRRLVLELVLARAAAGSAEQAPDKRAGAR